MDNNIEDMRWKQRFQNFKKAFEYEIIKDGEIWPEMLEQRNLMAHTYSEEIFSKAVQMICEKYYQAVEQVYEFLLKE